MTSKERREPAGMRICGKCKDFFARLTAKAEPVELK